MAVQAVVAQAGTPVPASQASASYANLTIEVVDLDLSDGVAAGWQPVAGASILVVAHGNLADAVQEVSTEAARVNTRLPYPLAGSFAAAVQTEFGIASYAMQGEIATVQGHSDASGGLYSVFAGFYVFPESQVANVFHPTGIEISAHTALVVSVDARIAVQAVDHHGALTDLFGNRFTDTTHASVQLTGYTANCICQQDSLSLDYFGGGADSVVDQALERRLSVTVTNATAASALVGFSVKAEVLGLNAAPVPEPASALLMLAGGLALAPALRRRTPA